MSSQVNTSAQETPGKRKGIVGWIVMLVVLLGGAAYGAHVYQESMTREITDNAQIDANIVAISARARGQVKEVKVKDNASGATSKGLYERVVDNTSGTEVVTYKLVA